MIVETAVALVAVAAALLALEFEDLLKSVVSFGVMCFAVAILFWLLDAPYVAVFQALIYGGAILALFIAAVVVLGRGEEGGGSS